MDFSDAELAGTAEIGEEFPIKNRFRDEAIFCES